MSVAEHDARLGLGCMRLSELGEDEAIAVVHAALESGVTLLDTADVYGRDARDGHGNERLLRRALASWSGPRPQVVTKAGLLRTTGKWGHDGRAGHLRAACDASLEALGVDALDALLLHAPDPRTPIETSVRALASLRAAGLVRAIGLSNVTLAELDRAREITEIALVEIAISLDADAMLRSGVIERCAEHGIRVLAHSPLGGPKRASKLAGDAVLAPIAAKHGASAAAVALAWLRDLSPVITPIPGVRSIAHAREVTQLVALDAEDRAALDRRAPSGIRIRVPLAERRPPRDADREVVILMGVQGAGKSTIARELEAEGCVRLNRDELGGKLRGLVPRLEAALAAGARRVVLDNTYATRASRAEVIDAAWRQRAFVRCVWLDTPLEVAQANVARRMVERHGRMLSPDELALAAKSDPSIVPPLALFRFRRELEAPREDEGFDSVEIAPFVRRPRPGAERGACFVAHDALDAPATLARLRERAESDVVLAFGWTPGALELEAARASVSRASSALGRPIELATCAHPAGPPVCWCRPPLPGLAVLAIDRHALDVARVEVVSGHAAHEAIADAIGARFVRV